MGKTRRLPKRKKLSGRERERAKQAEQRRKQEWAEQPVERKPSRMTGVRRKQQISFGWELCENDDAPSKVSPQRLLQQTSVKMVSITVDNVEHFVEVDDILGPKIFQLDGSARYGIPFPVGTSKIARRWIDLSSTERNIELLLAVRNNTKLYERGMALYERGMAPSEVPAPSSSSKVVPNTGSARLLPSCFTRIH